MGIRKNLENSVAQTGSDNSHVGTHANNCQVAPRDVQIACSRSVFICAGNGQPKNPLLLLLITFRTADRTKINCIVTTMTIRSYDCSAQTGRSDAVVRISDEENSPLHMSRIKKHAANG